MNYQESISWKIHFIKASYTTSICFSFLPAIMNDIYHFLVYSYILHSSKHSVHCLEHRNINIFRLKKKRMQLCLLCLPAILWWIISHAFTLNNKRWYCFLVCFLNFILYVVLFSLRESLSWVMDILTCS